MADLTRAEELVQTMERDGTFRTEVEAAPTVSAKRAVLDAHGYQDVGIEDMRAYVESKGGKLIIPEGGRELNEQEMAAVAGGKGTILEAPVDMTVGFVAGGVAVGAAVGAAA